MKRNTEALFTKNFIAVNDIDPNKIGTEAEEVICLYEDGKIQIPVLVAYRNGGVNHTGAKIAYKAATLDTGKIYAVVCTPEHFIKEGLAEVLLTKVYALKHVLNGEDTVRAEAMARAELAHTARIPMRKVNFSNRKNAIRNEVAITKAGKEHYKNLKNAEKSALIKEENKKVDLLTVMQEMADTVTDKLDSSEVQKV